MTDHKLYDKIDEFFEVYYLDKLQDRYLRLDWELQDFLTSHPGVKSEQWELVYPRIQFNIQKLESIFK